jgi:hypothetical protein
MRQMRLKMMTAPVDFGQEPTPEFPCVFGVVVDWRVGPNTITVVALRTGDASIYSTATFGVLGGIGHESVRAAARECVKVAQRFYDDARPTKEYPYPGVGRVFFYLVCYDGVRVIDAGLDAVIGGGDGCRHLFVAVDRVVTELRIIAQKKDEMP